MVSFARDVLRSAQKDTTRLTSCTNDVQHMLSLIVATLKQKPVQIGYPECGGTVEDHVTVLDGLGQTPFLLPLDLCRTQRVSLIWFEATQSIRNTDLRSNSLTW